MGIRIMLDEMDSVSNLFVEHNFIQKQFKMLYRGIQLWKISYNMYTDSLFLEEISEGGNVKSAGTLFHA